MGCFPWNRKKGVNTAYLVSVKSDHGEIVKILESILKNVSKHTGVQLAIRIRVGQVDKINRLLAHCLTASWISNILLYIILQSRKRNEIKKPSQGNENPSI